MFRSQCLRGAVFVGVVLSAGLMPTTLCAQPDSERAVEIGRQLEALRHDLDELTRQHEAALATDTAEPKSPASSGFTRRDALMASLSIFVLAVFVGFEVITKVPPTLHTPLMSGSNAISGITVVGAMLVAGSSWLGVFAVVFATINAVGGFWVTHRMLGMFQRK